LVIAGIVKSLTLNPATVTDGWNSYGTVTLEQAVPTATVVGLAALDPGVNPMLPGSGSNAVSIPSQITIDPGHTQKQFTIQTSGHGVPPHQQISVKIMAAAGAMQVFATLKIDGA
jgi:hypothetical protein